MKKWEVNKAKCVNEKRTLDNFFAFLFFFVFFRFVISIQKRPQ